MNVQQLIKLMTFNFMVDIVIIGDSILLEAIKQVIRKPNLFQSVSIKEVISEPNRSKVDCVGT